MMQPISPRTQEALNLIPEDLHPKVVDVDKTPFSEEEIQRLRPVAVEMNYAQANLLFASFSRLTAIGLKLFTPISKEDEERIVNE